MGQGLSNVFEKPLTARALVKLVEAACEGKFFAHVTFCFLGCVLLGGKADIDELCKILLTGESFKVKLVGITRSGPKNDLLAYKVELYDGPLKVFAEELWNRFGQLEEWQIEAGLSKGLFDAPLKEGEYRQKHHITMGRESPELLERMESFIGSDVQIEAFDIKQVGPHDPCYTQKL